MRNPCNYPGYYAIAKRRIETAQPPLFVADEPAQVAPEQAAMFAEQEMKGKR